MQMGVDLGELSKAGESGFADQLAEINAEVLDRYDNALNAANLALDRAILKEDIGCMPPINTPRNFRNILKYPLILPS